MLTRLVLQNIAIIEAVDIGFQPGLNVITGETGSGKSLILESIQRVFEKRTSPKELLKNGASRGRIELSFDLKQIHNRSQIETLLEQSGLEILPEESDLIISRDLTPSGSRGRVNGCPVTLDLMERLGTVLLEMYGQHDLHTLFSPSRQRDLLDSMGGEPLLKVRQEVRRTFREMQQLKIEIESLKIQQQERERQLDFLDYQIQEISQAEISDPHEDEQLQQERERLSHSDSLRHVAQQSAYILTGHEDNYESTSIFKLLNQTQKLLNSGSTMDTQFTRWYDQVIAIHEQLRLLNTELERYADGLDTRPERMQEIVDRLDTLEKLKRKYGGSLESVLKTAIDLESQLESLQQAETHLADLEVQVLEVETRYLHLCKTLTELRQKVNGTLEENVQEELQVLMLPAAQFAIDHQTIPPSETGQDQITFMFSANPGEPLKPLAQVASGGELSRLMLALKIQTAHADGITTLILDEIDTGMSGITVRAVADKLQLLQQQCQIIVITHQPILAAKASSHYHVEKHLRPDGVDVYVEALSSKARRKEVLSQLASGFTENDTVTAQFIEQLLI